VAELFEQLESASGKQKLTVFDQIKTELELHTHIEETIFYPALEEPKETHDLTLEAYEEHDVVKNLLKQLSKAKSANDEWDAQAKVLQENVEHHVEEEEGQLFKKASKALSAEEIENLGEEMEAEKARKQRGSSKSSSSKKASSSNKSASKTTAGGRAAKRTRGSSKKSSGSKSSASKTRGRSSSKKSASKKR
jgi:hypothetical protein